MKLLSVFVTTLMICFATFAIAGKPGRPQPDVPVTAYISDYSGDGIAYYLQSDGLGAYQNGSNGGYNMIQGIGDWLLDMNLSTNRTGLVTFQEGNLVTSGDPGYIVDAIPPYMGTRNNALRISLKCASGGVHLLQLQAGDRVTCPALFRMAPTDGTSNYYRLSMWDLPEVQETQVTCNSADVNGCNDWFIDPIPFVNGDGSTSPGKSRARMEFFSIGKGGKSTVTNRGTVYMTYHIHITRP